MPFNVLLLPLLGGYVLLTRWHRTRFVTRRYSGERLLLHAALAGVLFLTSAFAITRLLLWLVPGLGAWWRGVVPFPFSGTALLAFVLGAFSPLLLNRLTRFDFKAEADRAIETSGDYLEKTIIRSQRRVKEVCVTLKSGKVYIGFVTESFDPAFSRQYITLLPLQSGFRTETEHRLVLTTDYAIVYDEISRIYPSQSDAELDERLKDFNIVLPVAEIQSINIFDREAYQLFNPPQDSPGQSELELA